MALSYDDAVAELYRSPHDAFVAERKRLAQALKAGGDKAGAARFAKLGRPPISAWAVNQLWWQERDAFEQLFAVAARLRAGDQSAAGARRDTLAALKARAASVLVQGGHAANEATLRRVTTTLSALAATGSFEPDAPGALAVDRDPPGFDLAGAFGGADAPSPASSAPQPSAPQPVEPLPAALDAGEERRRLELVRERAAAVQEATARDATARDATPVSPAGVDPSVAQERERAERQQLEAEQLERARRERERLERAERERLERERIEREQAAEAERRREAAERAARRAERERLQESLPILRADLERRQREVERLCAEVERVERLAEQARTSLAEAEARLDALGAAD